MECEILFLDSMSDEIIRIILSSKCAYSEQHFNYMLYSWLNLNKTNKNLKKRKKVKQISLLALIF